MSQKADYALKVSGDSMEPDFYDGEIILVKSQNKVLAGDIGIFVLNGESYIKEFRDNRLISHNKKYEDISIIDTDSFFIQGLVLGKVKYN